MKTRRVISVLVLALMATGVFAQRQGTRVKIVDNHDVATVLRNVTSSSSSSCNTSDFPVYQGSNRSDINFSDLQKVIVRHDTPASDVNNYITLELVNKDGKSGMYEMVKNIRFTGLTDDGRFSIKVEDIKSVEIL